jgi:hypothetical protein
MTKTQKETAYNLGAAAARAGKQCVPAKDEALMEMVRTINRFGEGGKLCRAWSEGFIQESNKTEKGEKNETDKA